jgi:hypothetical protein
MWPDGGIRFLLSRFGLDETYAAECEGFFRQGTGAFIQGPRDVEGDWLEPGDPGYDEPPV